MVVLSAMVFGWSRGSVEPPLAAGSAAPKPVGWPGNQSAVRVASGLDLQRCSRMHSRIAPHTSNSGQSGSNEKCLWLALRAAVLRLAISSLTASPTPPAAHFGSAGGAVRKFSPAPLLPPSVAGTVGMLGGKVNHS